MQKVRDEKIINEKPFVYFLGISAVNSYFTENVLKIEKQIEKNKIEEY